MIALFCLRTEHVRGLIWRSIREVITNSSRYYLPHADEQGVYHDEFDLNRTRRPHVTIELTSASHRPLETGSLGGSEISLRDGPPSPRKSTHRVYDTSADVAQPDIELSKGKMGLVGFKMVEDKEFLE